MLEGAEAAKARALVVTVNANEPDATPIDWAAIDTVTRNTSLPVIVKGITRPQDAKEAVARGAKSVAVSNWRGGDASALPGTLLLLGPVVQAIGGQVLLGTLGRERLVAAIDRLQAAGARRLAGDAAGDDGFANQGPCRHRPTLLEVTAAELVARPEALLVEAFGNATMLVRCAGLADLLQAVACVPGSLGASIYAAQDGRDDAAFEAVAAVLVPRAGRIVENRMPTGLAVVPSMQHGGPWPSAGPPFFSAVGMPWTLLRFARRICFDGWTQERLPECLRNPVPPGEPWRFIDSAWTRAAACDDSAPGV